MASGNFETPSSTMIHCYRVTIRKQNETLTINSQTLPSFFLNGGAGRDIPGILVKCFTCERTINLLEKIFLFFFRFKNNTFKMD